ncbi:MAG TPA: hypothetical protein VGO56_13905, partial [Pyrinomonadaceae bacterium]|nr:hypothetical protein [Pyrinomonadaceae bacterium]
PTPAWKSLAKKRPDFPTFPQLLLLDIEMAKTDTSLANKTGHFNLLITCPRLTKARYLRQRPLLASIEA